MRLSQQRTVKFFCPSCPINPTSVKRIYTEGGKNFCSSECVVRHRDQLQGNVFRTLLMIPRNRALTTVP